MRFTQILSVAAFAGFAVAQDSSAPAETTTPAETSGAESSSAAETPTHSAEGDDVVYTTLIKTAFTTYCPGPTVLPVGNKTYTVTEATTLTITDCPCLITKTGVPPPPDTNVPPPNTNVPPPVKPTEVPVAAAGKAAAGMGALVMAGAAFVLI